MHSIATFYRFCRLATPEAVVEQLRLCGPRNQVSGLVLVGTQGVNATVSAPSPGELYAFIAEVEQSVGFGFENVKESVSEKRPFRRFRVRLERELITFGQPEADPVDAKVGTYVEPKSWNDLIARDDVLLIDTRNDYETLTGKFEGAIDPQIDTFSDFAKYVDEKLSPDRTPKIAMYCTGGIRCEVASSYLLQKGFSEVFHLQGGILKYLEEVPKEASRWQGECFVFDERVTVDHALAPGEYTLCLACSWPTPRRDYEQGTYAGGAACAHCIDTLSDAHLARAKERLRQRKHRSHEEPSTQQK